MDSYIPARLVLVDLTPEMIVKRVWVLDIFSARVKFPQIIPHVIAHHDKAMALLEK